MTRSPLAFAAGWVCVFALMFAPRADAWNPNPNKLLPYEHCTGEGGECTCHGIARWGWPMDTEKHPEYEDGYQWVRFLSESPRVRPPRAIAKRLGAPSATTTPTSFSEKPRPARVPRPAHLPPPSRTQTYAPVRCMQFACEPYSWRISDEPPAGAVPDAVGKGVCQCSRIKQPDPPAEEDLDYQWCSEGGELCDCDGRLRYGHTGLASHYENNSAFFKANPDLVRHVSVDVSVAPGEFKCDMSTFPWEKDAPWAGHPEMASKMNCQCARYPKPQCVQKPPSPSAPTAPPPPPAAPDAPMVHQPPTAPGLPPPPHPWPPPNPSPPTFPPVPIEVPPLVYIDPAMLDEPGDPPELPEERDEEDLAEDAKKAELMEEVSIDVLPGVKPWLVEWNRCADSGGLCDCPGTIRYGHAGMKEHYENDGAYFKENPHVVRWMMRMGDPDEPTPCTRAKFGDRDPFPDIPEEEKMCLCAPLVKPYQYKISGVTWGQEYDSFGAFFEVAHDGDRYRDCANKGEFCECDGTVRIGQPSHAVPQSAYRSFWKEIFLQHDDLHKVQGRWFMRATDESLGGVQCVGASFLTDNNEKRLTDATVDDAVRCQCLPKGSGDDHATYYPEDVVDEVQLISLDSIVPETVTEQQAALGEAYLADDRRISELMASGATRVAALGRTPELGRAEKKAKAKATESESKRAKATGAGGAKRASKSGTEVKADSEPPSKAKGGAATAKAGSAENREGSRRRSSGESSAVGLKQARANATVRRFGGATPTKAAAATAALGIFAALGVAATRLRRSTLRASEERQPLIPGR
jgi:hypothetical protein